MSMRNLSLILYICSICICITGCSLRPTISNGSISEAEQQKAIAEEEEAMNTAPVFKISVSDMKKQLRTIKTLEDVSNHGLCILQSQNKYLEIQLGEEDDEYIETIYITINSFEPLKNKNLMTELDEVIKLIVESLGESYERKSIVENLEKIKESEQTEEVSYSDTIDLFLGGLDGQIDLRIYPK